MTVEKTAFDNGPQTYYDNTAPEVPTDPPYPVESSAEDKIAVAGHGHGKKRYIVWVLLAGIALAIAIGVGVGVPISRRNQSTVSSMSPSTTASSPSIATTSSPSTATSTAGPTATPERLTNGALNDTSLASVLTSDGNRHLFFQDINGTLRHALYSAATNGWHTNVDFLSTSPAPRHGTPIAVLEARSIPDLEVSSGATINVYYVSTENTLAGFQYTDTEGLPLAPDQVLNLTSPVAPTAKSLTIARFLSWNITNSVPTIGTTTEVDEAFLAYENPWGNVSILRGVDHLVDDHNDIFEGWHWENVSESFFPRNSTLAYGGWLSAPFTFYADQYNLIGYYFNPTSASSQSTPVMLASLLSNFSLIGKSCPQLAWIVN